MDRRRWRLELRTHGWWIVLALLSATAVTLALGPWLLPAYGLINVGGVWALRRDLGTRRRGLQLLLSVGAILLVPVGVLGPLFSRGGPSPSEAASSASGDPDVRSDTARGSHARGPIGGHAP